MSDIKLYSRSGKFPYDEEPIEELDEGYLDASTVTSRLDIIANKVLRYFLTEKGTDQFSPEFGVKSLPISQMNESYFPKFKLEVEEDVSRCLNYYKNSERRHKERLARINIEEIRLRDEDKPGKVELVLEIVTNKSNRGTIEIR